MMSRWVCLFVGIAVCCASASAEVVRFQITDRQPLADGASFGERGPYERIDGRVFYELDPNLSVNKAIVDLALAPRNSRGCVEFWADLCLLAPQDATKANGAVLYDVNNRGNKLALGMFNEAGGNNPRTKGDCGNGFLMEQGFTIVWCGWDGELLPGENRLRLSAPLARSGDTPLTGLVRCEIVLNEHGTTRTVINWANHGSYRPTAKGLANATLTMRPRPSDERQPVPPENWKLHVSDVSSDSSTQLPKIELEIPDEFEPGWIYEVIYEAQDPLVMGVGFAAVRDLITALKDGSGTDHPLLRDGKPWITRAHGFGVSQSGRFLREYLHAGFNADERGRKVFDGLIPHVAGGGLGSFNHRFAQPTRHTNQHDHHDYPPDRFPFAYDTQTDPLSGLTDGILAKAVATNTVPKVFHTQSTAEYWTRAGSLPHTDPSGQRDATVPDNVRFYTFGGTQHGPSGYPPGKSQGIHLNNPANYKPFLRALLLALDQWAKDDVAPPPSVYPRIADGTLVAPTTAATGFPTIPGVTFPAVIHAPLWLDHGPRWISERIIDHQPPRVKGTYTVLVPRCRPDGNELGCLSPPEVAVPVGTYTGWNIRTRDAGAPGELVSLTGSFIPFARTKDDRLKTSDPREAVMERYSTLAEYTQRVTTTCEELHEQRFLTAADVKRLPALLADRVRPLFETKQD
ncbi:MAG: alpha/beta hydrolase domain-containing protein [Planctomycetaceae bacterium]|nr:alpha/beta hydrolase domain-containing protein [Planctomycetaceae bacterium]